MPRDAPGLRLGIVFADGAGRVRHVNPVAEFLSGWTLEEARGARLCDTFRIIDARTGTALGDALAELGDDAAIELAPGEALLLSRDGRILAIEATCTRLPAGYALAFRDWRHSQRLAHQLDYQGSHDPLTGLVNRAEFLRRARALVTGRVSNAATHAMVYLDLDQFKVVNNTSGHEAGDELLRQIATLLLPQLRDTDLLGRLGGDEFGLLLCSCALRDAERLSVKLIECIRQHSFRWQDALHTVSASAGVVAIQGDAADPQRALAWADTACFLAKERGRGRVQTYEPEDPDIEQYRSDMAWVSRIAAALGEDRLRLRYQPIMPTDPADEWHIEALLYLLDERGQHISPATFIPAAERYNLMPAVDRWVVNHAFAQLARQSPRGCPAVLCINLSAMTLCDAEFPEYVRLQFAVTGVDPNRICFEITETAATANPLRTMAIIEQLSALGCRFALDDFGQGLSSFGYLRQLQIDYLKIDGAFVRGIATNPVDRAMVAAINNVGHVIGVKTVAECVENEEVLRELQEIGVDYVQGYGIARPQPDCDVPLACAVHGTSGMLGSETQRPSRATPFTRGPARVDQQKQP